MRFSLIRADDLLALEVETFNLVAVRAGAGYELRPEDTSKPSYLAATYGPQHIVEYAATEQSPRKPQAQPFYSDRTRVVFRAPPGAAPIPLSVAGLLQAMRDLELEVDPLVGNANPVSVGSGAPVTTAALVAAAMAPSAEATVSTTGDDGGPARSRSGRPSPVASLLAELEAAARLQVDQLDESSAGKEASAAAVAASEAAASLPDDASATPESPAGLTALNFPSELSLSPMGGATRFAHATEPVVNGSNVELWHSRLALRTTAGGLVERTIGFIARRAKKVADVVVPSPGFDDATIKSPLTHAAALDIVRQTTQVPPVPQRARARRLMLSGLGAWLDAYGRWPGQAVQEWRHGIVMGRDQHVRLALKGRLYPLGHEAVLTSTMERRFKERRNGRAAELFTRTRLSITEPVRDFGGTTSLAGRQWPWRRIELLTADSPPVTMTVAVTDPTNGKQALVLRPEGEFVQALRFDCRAVDRGERVSTFDLPLVFVPDGFTAFNALKTWMTQGAATSMGFNQVNLHGQTVALAPAEGAPTPPDTTTVVAHSAGLQVENGGALGYRPTVPYVDGIVPALARFAGAAGSKPVRVTLAQAYLENGFDTVKNAGEALFAFAGPAIDVGGALTGGLVAPTFSIVGLSRRTGLVGGDPARVADSLARTALGRFDVEQWLAGALDSFTLFGVFKLRELIPDNLDLLSDAPRMVTQALDGISSQELTWSVPLFRGLPNREVRAGLARLRQATGAPEARLLVQATASVDPVTGRVHNQSICRVTDVELVIEFGKDELLVIPVARLAFTSADGRKPDVDAELGEIRFGGILRFLATLAALVDRKGFNDPPALEILPDGVRSSFSAPIPAVAIGMFALENITFGAALDIFFSNKPVELSLNFATFANPFRLTVAALGGGGYLGLRVNTGGLQELAGALEFGAALSVNLGVARGSVSVMGGIYFLLEGADAVLTGYLRVRGELDVLSLISVGVELMLALAYVSESNTVEGYAELRVRVKVVFIRKTVRVEFRKELAGANGDPTFAELMAPEGMTGTLPWDTYCCAFAEA